MGSRGQFIRTGGFVEYQYHTIARYNKVRYVVQNDNWKAHYKLTEISNTPWAVYAGINGDGVLKTISFYNGNRKKFKEIDLDRPHHGLSPHVHECDSKTSLRIHGKNPRPLTMKEKNKVNKIVEYYNKHNLALYAMKGRIKNEQI